MILNDPYTGFKVTPFFDAEYLRNGIRYRQFQWHTNKDLHMPYNDMKHRTVSLQQLRFLATAEILVISLVVTRNVKYAVY